MINNCIFQNKRNLMRRVTLVFLQIPLMAGLTEEQSVRYVKFKLK